MIKGKITSLFLASIMALGTINTSYIAHANTTSEVSRISNISGTITTNKYPKISNISENTILGADFSNYQQDLIWGKTYKDYKNNIDTNRYDTDTQKLDFSTANFSPAELEAQNRDLVKHADKFLTDEDNGLPVFLEPEAVQLLSFWCRTPQQMRRFIGIILNAKYAVEKEHKDLGVWILLDDPDLKKMMTKTLRRYFNALRSDEKHIKNVENYLYGTMQNLFGVWWNRQAAKDYAAKHPEEEKSADNDNSGLYY